MFLRSCSEGFKRALHDSLAADIDPRSGGHLAVHGQAEAFQSIEFRVVRPMANQVRIRDQYPGRFIVCPKFANRLSRLNEQRLIILEIAQ